MVRPVTKYDIRKTNRAVNKIKEVADQVGQTVPHIGNTSIIMTALIESQSELIASRMGLDDRARRIIRTALASHIDRAMRVFVGKLDSADQSFFESLYLEAIQNESMHFHNEC